MRKVRGIYTVQPCVFITILLAVFKLTQTSNTSMTILVVDHMENTIGKIINTLKSLIQGNVQVSKGKKKNMITK